MVRLVHDVMTAEVVAVEPWTPFMEIVAGLASPNQRSPSGARRPTSARVVSEADLLAEHEHPDPKADPVDLDQAPQPGAGNAAVAVAGRLMTTPAVTVPYTATVTEAILVTSLHASGGAAGTRPPSVAARG